MKFVIFVILVISALTIDHPQVNKVRDGIAKAIGNFVESEYSQDMVSNTVYKELEAKFDSFRATEEDYVKEITVGSKELHDFYQEYCKQSSFNPRISAYNLRVVCSVVGAHAEDLNNEVTRLISQPDA